MDFARAFDHVDHNVLMAKLMEFGLSDVIIRWTYSFNSSASPYKGGSRDVGLGGDGGWHATKVLPRATDSRHVNKKTTCFMRDAQVC